MPRRGLIALAVGSLALGVASEVAAYRSGELDRTVADALVGWVLIGCGLIAGVRRSQSRVGWLVAAAGGTWFLGGFATALLYLHRGPLVHALLSFPAGRVSRSFARAAIAAAYVDGAIEPLARSAVATLVLCAIVVGAAAREYVAATGARRRARAVATAGALAVAAVLAFGAVGRLAGWGTDPTALWAYELVLIGAAVAVAADLLGGRWSQGALTGLVVDLGALSEPVTLRDHIARALGDPSLELGYWAGDETRYVDESGRPVAIPPAGSGRVVTSLGGESERLAVLVHDPAVLQDRALLDAVAAASRIAVANLRLRLEVGERVQHVAASRRRIVEAADAQRSRLAGELQNGAERRLAVISEQVAGLAGEAVDAATREILADVERQLGAARVELGELARGIRPSTLTSGGLGVALPELAERAPVPVAVSVDAGRLPAAVEAAAYFVCGEALANVAKYADASRVQIDVSHRDGRLTVAIADDGAGGADASRGSGLRGLADRVEALGGRVAVESPSGHGTRITAEIPVA